MRNRVLLLALISILISLCVPSIAQQAYVKPEVFARYVVETGPISKETKARPYNTENFTKYTYQVPEGITVKKLISSLPGVRKNIFGKFRIITGKRKKVVVTINNFHNWHHQFYNEDSKLNNGTAFVQIKESDSPYYGGEIKIEYFRNVSYEMVGGNSEYVDLGLSVKWASHNVGATKPEEYGDYYAWGETEGFDSESSYKFLDDQGAYTKYNRTDGKTVLDSEDDVANVKWGGSWRIPTNDEINELIDNCNWTLASVNGVTGFLVTSKINGYTDRSIFLPCQVGPLEYVVDHGYWSGTLDSSSPSGAFCLYINDRDPDWVENSGVNSRSVHCTVRPVCE